MNPIIAIASLSCASAPPHEKNMNVLHVRENKTIRLAQPQHFMAQEREIVEAFAGDIIGLFDPGLYRIGDTLVDGPAMRFADIPVFAPEFLRVYRRVTP